MSSKESVGRVGERGEGGGGQSGSFPQLNLFKSVRDCLKSKSSLNVNTIGVPNKINKQVNKYRKQIKK